MTINFTINDRPFDVKLGNLPADITLNTFIREHAGLTGTKFMCQEGGCGVCVCVVRGKHPVTGEIRTWAVNSCLTLLNTCNNLAITTAEGLGNKRNGYHAIQKRLSKMNATQCGYCSPGIVMNMYALLEAKSGKATMAEIENSFGGNICRCTGYRPILDAMKSFAVDSNIEIPAECRDIEDLSTKTCPKTGENCNNSCKGITKLSPVRYEDGSHWIWAKSLSDVFNAFALLKENERYMLVAGNTAHGVYRRSGDIKTFIDITNVPDLYKHTINATSLSLGANLSLTETMNIFEEASKTPGFEYCQQLWQHFDLIANVPVRNMGTLAGNLSIKHAHREFPSDVFIVFEALNVHVVINESATIQKTLPIGEYLKSSMTKKIINSFVLKPYQREKYIFDSYKIMPRAQNAHAYVNAAFLLKIEKSSQRVEKASICFGGINPDFVHAKAAEDALIGKNLFDKENLANLLTSLKNQLNVDNVLGDASPEYRQKLAYSLFYKFILSHAPTGSVPEKLIAGGELLARPVSSGKQIFDRIEKNYPIFQPTEKHEGLVQTSGEATYANDLPTQPNQIWAALITAKKVGSTITNIDATEVMKIPGVIAFFTAKDIPGKNSLINNNRMFFEEDEELFLTGIVRFYNQPIGVIVAETNALACHAAELVKLTYSSGNTEVLPTLKDVLNSASSSDRVKHKIISPLKDLSISEQYDYKASGKLELGLQYHFFMEPHTTVAVPFEGGLQIYSATQWMDFTQQVIAQVLNLKHTEVQLRVSRLGGGYGGKGTRGNQIASAAALAAYKLNRPVRFVQSLESTMNTLGKRWSLCGDYDFYANSTGKIIGIKAQIYQDAGYLANESPLGHTVLLSKNCYEFSDNYKLDCSLVLSDSPSNTACRAPGSIEGIAIIENIIEHIAFEAGLDSVDVRLANLIPSHKMGEMLPQFIQSTQYKQRKQEVNAFNEKNRWRKRGLGFAVSEYHIGYFGQYPASVAVYHGDGTVIISHGGIEMGQGMNTKIAQVASHILEIPLDLIKVEGSNTVNGANSMVTGGSIGSEAICFVVRKCCTILNDRLKPVKETLKDANWQQTVEEAYNRNINMIVSDDCKPNDMEPYTVCGLCLTEVEVDVLTGNYLIKRVDLLEDTGESLNPNVDIGQIEGAFIMGLGYWTTEQIVVDKSTGELITNRTWNYKPPGAKDIPIDFRIELLKRSTNSGGFMGSKATGEPAICLAVAIGFALQHAIQSARDDAGLKKSWVTLQAPMTPEYVMLNCGTDVSMFKLD